MRILWLHGPPAVGKSVTAWAVLNALAELDPAVGYVDIDQLGMSCTDERDDADGHRLKARALAAVAPEYAKAGAQTLVVSGVIGIELEESCAEDLRAFDPMFVRLTVSDTELRRRLEARGEYAEGWEDVEAQARALEGADLGHPVVETGVGDPVEVAGRVLELVQGSAARSDSVGPPPTTTGDPTAHDDHRRALLIGGTTAVGKSTIGWQAFLAARERGQAPAFVDLRQLGFLGVDGGDIDHRFQARVAGALWQVFRAHGAQVLVMNGPVSRVTDVAEYRTALANTPLTAIRLTAQRSALVDRVRARLRGEMVALAGDRLVGRPVAEADAIAEAALQQQDRVQEDPAFRTLDTTSLDPGESARRVLSHLGRSEHEGS